MNWKDAAIENVKVGDNSFSLAISQKNDYKEYLIQQTQSDWTMEVNIENAKKVIVNDQVVDRKESSGKTIKLSGKVSTVQIY